MTRRALRAQAEADRTCGLAVIIPILIREADGVVVASVFVIALNLAHPVFFLALAFLPAVAGVPLFVELGETDGHHGGGVRKALGDRPVLGSVSLVTWCLLPFSSTQPHCPIGTHTPPFCTNPSLHTHPGLHASIWTQCGGPFRCVHVGVHAGTQGE